MKRKKSAGKKAVPTKSPRNHTNWKKFFELCKQGKSNPEIAKVLGWKIDPKSTDGFKRVRAAKSLARTKGIKIEGRVVFLRDAKLKATNQSKAGKGKTASRANQKGKPDSKAWEKDKSERSQTAVSNGYTPNGKGSGNGDIQ